MSRNERLEICMNSGAVPPPCWQSEGKKYIGPVQVEQRVLRSLTLKNKYCGRNAPKKADHHPETGLVMHMRYARNDGATCALCRPDPYLGAVVTVGGRRVFLEVLQEGRQIPGDVEEEGAVNNHAELLNLCRRVRAVAGRRGENIT